MGELQTRRHKRYEQECRDIAFKERLRCGHCNQELGKMRWWKCVQCEGECRDKIHPEFAEKAKDRDVENGVVNMEGDRNTKSWRRKLSAILSVGYMPEV